MKPKNGQAFLQWQVKARGKPPTRIQYIKKYRISTNNNPAKVRKYLVGLFCAKFAERLNLTIQKVEMSDFRNMFIFRHFYS